MIELNEFEYSRREHLKWLRMFLLWGGIYGLAYIVIVWCAWRYYIGSAYFLLTFLVACPFFLYFSFLCLNMWLFLPKRKNSRWYKKIKMSFDTDKFHMQTEDGSEYHVLLSAIVQVQRYRFSDCYWMVMDDNASMHIPVSAFRSEEDRIRFEKEILGDKLKKVSSCSWWELFIIALITFVVTFTYIGGWAIWWQIFCYLTS
jgi:hypothetical protein